jgi:hypothetical protein
MRIVQNEGAPDDLNKLDQPGRRPSEGGLDQPGVGSVGRVGR